MVVEMPVSIAVAKQKKQEKKEKQTTHVKKKTQSEFSYNPSSAHRLQMRLRFVNIGMTPRNFVCDLLERPLTEAQPRTIKVGRVYQGGFPANSRVPFIRLAGRWLEEAGFSEGDVMQVNVVRGEIRLRRQNSSRSEEDNSKPAGTVVKPGGSKPLHI